ncbi:ATP synthase F1 subunit gamma [Patescibacteria group bacterium]|nr:ATP synthase F1 subunit gamma [Patescibacteria group bacterium]
MENARIIKRRIRSAKNIQQITKAMTMVAASKMRRSQEKALSTRPYSIKLREILAQLAAQVVTEKHKMLQSAQKEGTIGIMLISSDRGLCGALNTNLFRTTEEFKLSLSQQRPEATLEFEFITIGRKAREYVLRTGQLLHAEFTHFPERPSFEDILPITRLAIDGFLSGKFKEMYAVYTDFISTLRQEVDAFRILPVEAKKLELTEAQRPSRLHKEYIFEPNADAVFDALLPHYIEMQVFQIVLEAQASEHSARMVAMRNASENASEIISDLTLQYNRQRQQAITYELADMITARQAVSQTPT